MAAKKQAKKSATSGAKTSDLDRIIDAGLEEAAAVGWRHVAMTAVAARAELPLGGVLSTVPTRAHLLARFLDRLDTQTLSGIEAPDADDSVRDRLFEIVMRRFDAMNSQRDGVRAVLQGLRHDPPALATAMCRADRAAAAMLAAAGVSPDGLLGCARVQGFKVVLLCAVKAWMDDDSADLAKTMAALDRALFRAEQLAGFRGFRRPTADAA